MTLFNWFSTALAVLAIVTVIATATPRIAEKICVTIGGFAASASLTLGSALFGAYVAKTKITAFAKSAVSVELSAPDGSERSLHEIPIESRVMLAYIDEAATIVITNFFWLAVASVTLMAVCAAGAWLSREVVRDAKHSARK